MKKNIIIGTVGAVVAMATSAQAAEWTKHFRVGLDVAFNIEADFNSNGTFIVPSTIDGPSRSYDDGFVGVDDTGNAGNLTSFWGYADRDRQVVAPGRLAMNKTTDFTTSAGGATEEDAPYMGIDAVYGMSTPWRDNLSIGFEVGFSLLPIDIKDRRSIGVTGTTATDLYDINGLMLPPGSYEGGTSGIGMLLPTSPVIRTFTTGTGTLDGSRGVEGNLFSLRLGPMLRWQIDPSWSLSGSAGIAVGLMHADLVLDEMLNIPGSPSVPFQAEEGDSDITYGGYAGAVVMYDTGYYWEAFLGVHIMSMTDAELSGVGRRANLSLGAGIHITAGINWSF